MNTNSFAYIYAATFTNVIAASSQDFTLAIDAQFDFICDEIQPEFQLNGAYLSAIDGTPIVAFPTTVSGSSLLLPTLSHLRVAISSNGAQWQNTQDGVRVSALKKSSTAYLLSKPVLRAGESLSFKVWNDSPAPVKGQIILIGRRVPKGMGYQMAGSNAA